MKEINQNNKNFRFLYICPNKKCGNVIFKSKNYIEGMIRIKCQKCQKIFNMDELLVKKI